MSGRTRRRTGAAPDHPRRGAGTRLHRRPHGERLSSWPKWANGSSTSTASTPISRCSIPPPNAAALDAGGGVSIDEVTSARRAVRELTAVQAGLGGDPRARARELDLLQYQLTELDAAALVSPTEDAELREEEAWLSDAAALRSAAAAVADGLSADDGIVDRLGSLVARLAGSTPLAPLHDRLLVLQTELSDAATEGRAATEAFEDNPGRLAEVGARRHLLTDLRRKYGATLADVIEFRDQARRRRADLEDHDSRARRSKPSWKPPRPSWQLRRNASARSAGRWRPRSLHRSSPCCICWPCRRPDSRWRSVRTGPVRPSRGGWAPTRGSSTPGPGEGGVWR